MLQCLNQPWAKRAEFQDFSAEAWLLAKVISGYYQENSKGAAAQRARAASEAPARTPGQDHCTTTFYFRRKGVCPTVFQELWAALEQTNAFEPLIIDSFFPDGAARYSFLRSLQNEETRFPSAAYLYQHNTGNRLQLQVIMIRFVA